MRRKPYPTGKVVDLYNKGYSIHKIATILNESHHYVEVMLRGARVPVRQYIQEYPSDNRRSKPTK